VLRSLLFLAAVLVTTAVAADNSRLLQTVKAPEKHTKPAEGFRPNLQKLKVELGLLNYLCLDGLMKRGDDVIAAPLFLDTMAKLVSCIEKEQRRPSTDDFSKCLQLAVSELYGFVAGVAYPTGNAPLCPPPPPPAPVAPPSAPASAKVDDALVLIRDNNIEKAEPLLDEAIVYFDGVVGSHATSYLCARSPQEAKKITATFPDRKNANFIDAAYCDALFAKAQLLARRKDFDGALTALDRSASLRPGDLEVTIARGEMMTQLLRFHDAALLFEQAMRTAPPTDPTLRSRAFLGFATAQVGLKNLTAARKAAQESLRLDPQSSQARDELHYIETLAEQRRAQSQKR
jgi:tetratricopeptide (TPR) repeat protein